MEQYTDLRIVDCNRLNSIQARNGNNDNNALYTNDLGNGIQLDVGDEVSVHGAFISEIGAGSDTIEFKGNTIYSSSGVPKTKTLKYTKETLSYPTRDYDTNYENIMGGFQVSYSEEVDSDPITLKDNECTIQTEYWTSNNGAGYVFLPRRFGYNASYDGLNSSDVVSQLWTDLEDTIQGTTFNFPRYQMIIDDDYKYYRNGRSYGTKYPEGLYVPKHNNKRFTIMRRMDYTYFRDQIIRYEGEPAITPTLPALRNPALRIYKTYKKLVNLKVPKGMNSPSDVSKQITDDLKKSENPLVFASVDNTGIIQHITTTNETETWKPFNCATYKTFGYDYYNDFYSGNISDEAFKYYACYQNIAVKRPDLFELGRECNGYAGKEIQGDMFHVNRLTATIKTNYFYNEDTLQKLSNLFKAQGNYPELFQGKSFETHLQEPGSYNTIDNVRFLHMNTDTNIRQNNILGNDSYGADPSASGIEGFDYSSIPIFFKYQSQYADIETGGEDTNKLSYGFAMKYFNTTYNADMIELRPDLCGGIPIFNYQKYESNASGYVEFNIEDGRKIGWDWHFSAYSTMAMVLWGGRVDRDFNNNNEWAVQNASQIPDSTNGSYTNIAHLLTQRYVGANDPLFNFDNVSQRFYWSNLHTPETAGQTNILAGVSVVGGPQINSDYDNPVYKINPRFNRWELTPNLRPYALDIVAEYHGFSEIPTTDDQTYALMSRQISPFTIFDSDSGIYISDFGYNEDDFDKGIWAILGFTYNQFNASESSSLNRLTRINDDNKTNLTITTTNCEVVSSDTVNYNVNNYGGVFVSNQVTAPQVISGPNGIKIDGHTAHGGDRSVPSFPAITEQTESIRISAINLPRKMLRPYYLIRSDLIEQPKYVGHDNAVMSVIGICDKQYSGGDFYFGSDNAFSFRITKPRTITSITTSIHDPDGTFANLDEDSAVIYRIVKNVKADTNILAEYFSKKKSK